MGLHMEARRAVGVWECSDCWRLNSEAMARLGGRAPSRHAPHLSSQGLKGMCGELRSPWEGVQMLSSCEAGILPWVGTKAAAGLWLVGVPQPSSWFSLLFPSRPC